MHHAHHAAGLELAQAVAGASYNDLADPMALDVPSGNAALNGLAVWIEPAHD